MAAPVTGFDEIRFPYELSEGMVGGSVRPTRFIEMPSGREQRIKLAVGGRRRWTSDALIANPTLIDTAIDFWEARDGGARGFRLKDPNEYQVTDEPQTVTGTPTFQLVKSYVSGSQTRVKELYKPVSGTVVIEKNGSAVGGATVDTTTGIVTLPAVNSKSITGITQADPAVVTVGAAHGFAINDIVYISGVAGMTQINGQVAAVTATAASTITLGSIDSSAYSAYTSGGTAATYMVTADVITATLEFDWPVTFRQQQQELTADFPFARNWRIEMKELLD